MAAAERDKPVLSAVIPLYNESTEIKAVVNHIHRVMEELGIPFEIVLVDDGSTDHTWAQLETLAQQLPNLVAMRLTRNFGKEAAMAAGLNRAVGQAVVLLDGDLQHPPELIPKMVALWQQGKAEIVEAVKARRGKEAWWSRLGAAVFYRVHARLGGAQLEGASDFKLLDRRVVEAWQQMGERNIFFRGMTDWLGFRRTSISFVVPERASGMSRWTFWQLLRLAVTGITSFSSLPLHITTVIGACFLLFSFCLGLHTLYMKFSGQAVSGFATVILILLIMGSCILISIGIVGLYIARIYDEVKGRPRYLISQSMTSGASPTRSANE